MTLGRNPLPPTSTAFPSSSTVVRNLWEGPVGPPPNPDGLFLTANQVSFYKLGDENDKKLVEEDIRKRQGDWAVERFKNGIKHGHI